MNICPVLGNFLCNLEKPLDIDTRNTRSTRKAQRDRAIYLADWAARGWAADIAKQVGLDDTACDLSNLGDFYDLSMAAFMRVLYALEYKRTPKYYECINTIHLAKKACELAKIPNVARDYEDLGRLCALVYNMRSKYCSHPPATDLKTVIMHAIDMPNTPL